MLQTRTRAILGLAIGAAVLGTGGGAASAGDLIFADILNFTDPDGNSIRRIRTDGTGLETLVPTGGGLRGLDVDAAAGLVYWTDVDNFVIRRAGLDGTGQVDLVSSGLVFPSALRLHLPAGQMYWGDQSDDAIFVGPLSGGGGGTLTGTPFNRGLAIDNANGKIYWTTSITATTGQILRMNLDGSDQQVVYPTSVGKPGNLALDVAGGKIYWTDPISRFVRRANLDGSNVEPLYDATFVGAPKGIAVDPAGGKVYWAADMQFDESPLFGQIYEMNLDGTDVVAVGFGLGSVNDMVFVSDAAPCLADFDGNGTVAVPDIFAFLSAWFAGSPSADVDGTPGIGVPDIFFFLGAWFAGCP